MGFVLCCLEDALHLELSNIADEENSFLNYEMQDNARIEGELDAVLPISLWITIRSLMTKSMFQYTDKVKQNLVYSSSSFTLHILKKAWIFGVSTNMLFFFSNVHILLLLL